VTHAIFRGGKQATFTSTFIKKRAHNDPAAAVFELCSNWITAASGLTAIAFNFAAELTALAVAVRMGTSGTQGLRRNRKPIKAANQSI